MIPRRLIFAPLLSALLAPAATHVQAETITVTREDCVDFVRHEPAPDVAYRPGVDSRGRQVTPADLGDHPPIELPKEFAIPITVDLADRLGLPAGSRLFEPQTNIGTVVYRDGKAWFNGRELPSDGTAALIAACRKRLGKQE